MTYESTAPDIIFQSTLPLRGVTRFQERGVLAIVFQSTLPLRE